MGIYLNKIRRKVGFSYERNMALRLILSLGGFYIGLQALYIIIMVLADNQYTVLHGYYIPSVGLQSFDVLFQKPWIILSHFLYTGGFFELVTNLIWLYLFSSVIQTLVGYKEVLPIFLIGCLGSAFAIMGLNEVMHFQPYILMGCYAGVMAMGTAVMILSPNYKIYFTSTIAAPVWLLYVIFVGLNAAVHLTQSLPMVLWMLSGGIIGFVYMLLLKNGLSIGNKVYGALSSFEKSIGKNKSINKELHEATASKMVLNKENQEIDQILEKIHQKGLISLSVKEKELLEQFSNSL